MTVSFKQYSPEELLGPLNEVEKRNAPEFLYTAGDTELLRKGKRVSIVGARKASGDALKRASSLARILVEQQVIVVSGLAEGIDTAAHESAIRNRGRTIAVLGTPLDKTYPDKNRSLQQKIMQEHLAVSQFPPGCPSQRKNFPMRNRTMALLSDATVIVEARDGSGSLHQGWEALRLGRPLFLMESVTKNPDVQWPKEMLSYGAEILARDNINLLLELLPEGSRDERSRFAI
jgi:DNA processing protein